MGEQLQRWGRATDPREYRITTKSGSYPRGVREKCSMGRGIRREVLGRTKGRNKRKEHGMESARPRRDEGNVSASETRLHSRPFDEFSPLSWESGVRFPEVGGNRSLWDSGGEAQPIRQALIPMLVRALPNDIECHNGGRGFPPRADVDIDRRTFGFHDGLRVVPVLVLAFVSQLVVTIFVRENGLNRDTFAQAFSYPFHLQSAGSCLRSDLEGRFGGVDEE